MSLRIMRTITNNEFLIREALQQTQFQLADQILLIYDAADLRTFSSKIKSMQSLYCFDTTNILLILHYSEKQNIKPTYLMDRERWKGLGRDVIRGSRGIPTLVNAAKGFLKINKVYDVSQSYGRELYDFSTNNVSTETVYDALKGLSREMRIDFLDIQDNPDTMSYMLEETIFMLLTQEDRRSFLTELQKLTLSEFITAILAGFHSIPYIFDEYSLQGIFTREIMAKTIPLIIEVIRIITTVIGNISLY